jgi:hypothetical protein
MVMNTNLKLIEIYDSAWQSWQIEGVPFGIEKIAPRDYVIFRLLGSRRLYLRDTGFTSRDMALLYLESMVEKYKSSIITAITA